MPDQLGRLRELLAGRYQIEREVGRGGMATVYRALDVQHDRPVALKVLNPDLAAALGGERFQREIRLAARLQHPHILGVYDSGTSKGYLWFTMPFVEGESLRDRLNREGPLPIADAVRICRETALALEFAHRHGVVHRDIKPENILLIDGQAMVADFGIARALGGTSEALTSTGMVIGTPGYMSPEQASGDARLDARTDTYSLGCVLYEVLAGEPPFTGPTVQAVIVRVMSESPRPLSSLRPSVSPRLAEAVAQAMAKAPADRPATSGEFARLLESAVTQPTTAHPPLRDRRLRWIAISAAAVLVLAFGLVALLNSTRDRGGPEGERKIAVLPFENAGSPEDEYFADGMADEVRSRLSAVNGIRVTARASSAQYKRSPKSPKEIGRELDVQYVLAGTVRWMKGGGVNRVRVTPELIDVSNLETRWSQPYDTVLSDVFAVQASIASQVAGALHVALAGPEQARLEERSTVSVEAYDAFLKGKQISAGGTGVVEMSRAAEHYERAVQLDSTFIRGWSELAQALASIHSISPTTEGVERARQAAMRTVQLGPDRHEARLAMGAYLSLLKQDLVGAREQYLAGLRQDPNNVDMLGALSGIERATGRFDEALTYAKRAAALDPRSAPSLRRLAVAHADLFQFHEALDIWDRVLALTPEHLSNMQGKASSHLALGQLDSVHALIREKLRTVDTTALLVHFSYYLEMMWALPSELWPKIVRLTPADFRNDRGQWGLKLGHTWRLLGDTVRARAYGDSARAAFEQQLRAFPERAQLQELLGRALALGGHGKDAIAAAERSLELRQTTENASLKPYVYFQAARIMIQSGQYDRAIDLLEPTLTMQASNVTPAYLRLDPSFQPLVTHPRFQRLLQR